MCVSARASVDLETVLPTASQAAAGKPPSLVATDELTPTCTGADGKPKSGVCQHTLIAGQCDEISAAKFKPMTDPKAPAVDCGLWRGPSQTCRTAPKR